MVFENKRAADVEPEDMSALVERRIQEEQRLDLKRDPYGSSDTDKREMLRDIVALANADGGYLVIGVEEDEESRATRIRGVTNAASEVRRMLDLATTGISPRIVGLEIASIPTREGDVILVRVPETVAVPHMVSLHNRTYFCRRHGTIKREMSMDEIRSAFTEDETSRRLSRIEEGMDRLTDSQDTAGLTALDLHPANEPMRPGGGHEQDLGAPVATRSRPDVASTDTTEHMPRSPLDSLSPRNTFRHQTDLRASSEMGDTPYYRACITPDCIDASIEFSEALLSVLREPTGTRRGGWHIWKLELRPCDGGVVGVSSAGHYVILLRNGHMEFRQPLLDTHTYQWRQGESEAKLHPWLYPYALIELPISFFRLAKTVYEALEWECPGVATHALHNPKGFVLYPGHPESISFGMDGHEWGDTDYKGPELSVESICSFEPDSLVFRLIADLYTVAGFSEEDIPLFNEERNFSP